MHPRVVLNSLFRTWELVRQTTCSILELVISEQVHQVLNREFNTTRGCMDTLAWY